LGLSATKRTIPGLNLSPNLVTHLPLRQEDGSSTPAATTITAGTVDKNQISMVKSKRGEGGETTYTLVLLFAWFCYLAFALPRMHVSRIRAPDHWIEASSRLITESRRLNVVDEGRE